MKKFLLALSVPFTMVLHAQNVGIGTNNPAAKLDISSTNSGILIPRVALLATNNGTSPISSPTASMLVYNTATAASGSTAVTPGFYYWSGSSWTRLIDNTAASNNIYNTDGSLTGNRTVTDGANNLTFSSTTGNLNFTTTSGVNQTTGGNVAMGNSVTASGGTSVAFGTGNTASGVASFSTGWVNTASGALSQAVGQQNTASGYASFANNLANTASGGFSTATGKSNTAGGDASMTSGFNNQAPSFAEFAAGLNGTTYTPSSATTYNAADRLFNVGNGSSPSSLSDAFTILKGGNVGIGNNNPTQKLDVNGTTKTTNFRMTSGAANGYLLQSDASGNASWADPNASQWGLSGNSGTTSSNFLGTTDNNPLYIKTNGAQVGYLPADVTGNIVLGKGTGSQAGTQNVVMGNAAGKSTTGNYNVSVGWQSLRVNTTGSSNAALGPQSLLSNTTGTANSAAGSNSLALNTTGSYNAAIGNAALYGNTLGSFNVGLGTSSLNSVASGSNNVAVGANAGYSTTGGNNVFLGYSAGYFETGSNKLYLDNSNTTTPLVYGDFTNNHVTVNDSLTAKYIQMTSGAANGYVLKSDANGNASWSDPNSIQWGLTGNAGTTSSNFLGTTDNNPLYIKTNGAQVGYLPTDPAGNIVFGKNTGSQSGTQNIVLGNDAGKSTTGTYNVSLGWQSLSTNTTGSSNVAIGGQSMISNLSGTANSSVGPSAMTLNTSGSYNTALGNAALFGNTLGNFNVGLGTSSLHSVASGSNNVAVGTNAGYSTTGGNNLFLGYSAGYFETGSNKLYIDNTNTTTPLVYGDFTNNHVTVNDSLTSKYLQITSGAANGYVLQSDASGNASWVSPTSFSSQNIYNTDGSLTGNRTVTDGANNLTFSSTTGNLNFTTTSGVNQTSGGNVAMGNTVTASGGTSVAFGTNNTASGVASLVTGWQNNATGALSVAFGQQNTASGYTSFAVNIGNLATGSYSSASGKSNIATGDYSSVAGMNNTAPSFVEHVVGINATIYTPTSATAYSANDRIFNIGNGSSVASRSDALTVLKSGNVGIGVSTPIYKLDILGNLRTTSEVYATTYLRADGASFLFASGGFDGTSNVVLRKDATNAYIWPWGTGTSSNTVIVGGGTNTNMTVTGNFGTNGNATVSGKTTTSTFQMTSGGALGSVLVSDASGNGTWTSAATVLAAFGTGTQNYLTKWNNASGTTIGNSQLYDNGSAVSINTTSTPGRFNVNGSAVIGSGLTSRSGSGLSVDYSNATTYAANADPTDAARGLSIVNEGTTANSMALLGFRVNPAGGANNQMMDMKLVNPNDGSSKMIYTFISNTTPADRFAMTSAGTFGIGTTTPAATLDVNTTTTGTFVQPAHFFAPSNTANGNATQIRVGTAASNYNSTEIRLVNGAAAANNVAQFGLYGTTGITVNSLGALGVGTANPGATVDVNGTTRMGSTGTIIKSMQMGQATIGAQSQDYSYTLTFPGTFANAPKVIATCQTQTGQTYVDNFSIIVQSVSTTSCVLRIHRTDATTNWGQTLLVNWIAFDN